MEEWAKIIEGGRQALVKSFHVMGMVGNEKKNKQERSINYHNEYKQMKGLKDMVKAFLKSNCNEHIMVVHIYRFSPMCQAHLEGTA